MTLTAFERRWAATIGRALVPSGALGGALDAIDVGARYAHECAISPWYAALAFRASLWLTWLAPLWMLGRARSFGGVDDETRVVVLERLLKHRRYMLRMAALFLKLAILGMLLGDTPTLAQLGAYKLRKSA
ncbi:MAG TPA: hypothetical protein VF945_12155 [Polyangia bacterium]